VDAGARPRSAGVVLRDVRRTYRGRNRDVVALDGVTLSAAPGEVLAVVGPSGCGKSTLLELICGLQIPDAGTVTAPPAGYLPQHGALLPWANALDNVALPLLVAGTARARARAQAHPLLTQLGLDGFERVLPRELSGGMRQRVAIARTLLTGRPLLALDEPFGALDAITRAKAQEWLGDALRKRPSTVLLVTHDVEEAVLLADRVVVLSERPGRVVTHVEIRLPRPRRPTDAAVVALRAELLEALR
jgi:NitT/TauT family transport system ATP-binding protein